MGFGPFEIGLILLFGAAPIALICILVLAWLRKDRRRSGLAEGVSVDELASRIERIEAESAQIRLSLADATGATDIGRRLKEAEAALAASQRRLEKLEAVVVDQLLDEPDPPVAIEEGRGSSRQEKESIH